MSELEEVTWRLTQNTDEIFRLKKVVNELIDEMDSLSETMATLTEVIETNNDSLSEIVESQSETNIILNKMLELKIGNQ